MLEDAPKFLDSEKTDFPEFDKASSLGVNLEETALFPELETVKPVETVGDFNSLVFDLDMEKPWPEVGDVDEWWKDFDVTSLFTNSEEPIEAPSSKHVTEQKKNTLDELEMNLKACEKEKERMKKELQSEGFILKSSTAYLACYERLKQARYRVKAFQNSKSSKKFN